MVRKKLTKSKRKKRVKVNKHKAKRIKVKGASAKKITRSRAQKARAVKPPSLEAALEKIGEVTHYFPKVKAAAVLILKDSLRVGDGIYIKGHTTNFKEKVASMQLNHVAVEEGLKSQEIGLLVKSRVRIGDSVYKL